MLQNNGRLAHQEVDHVHFHLIPKPNDNEGLGIGWPAQKLEMDELKKYYTGEELGGHRADSAEKGGTA